MKLGIYGRALPLLAQLSLLVVASQLTAAQPVDYRTQIKPLLIRHCVRCHGAKKQEAGLRLDYSGGILRGGDSGPAILAKRAKDSRLLIAILGSNEEISKMPPEGQPLSAAEVSLIRRWIDEGAKAPKETATVQAGADHWAFKKIRRPQYPPVRNRAWIKNGIDYFVLRKLEQVKLAPSPRASRATLIRRLKLDLLGILPTVEEVDAFVSDARPNAYELLVDRLLSSPEYGERWGRHWLDLARYADSNGYTRDFGRQIWKYRDWVIDAVNRDKAFDQFTIEQIAGDMLPRPSLSQLVATGFHRNTLINEEGGTDKEQFRVDAVADRVNTTGSVFLGLTVGCARCHQHKYDPISQREYYQLFAFLDNCDEPTIDAPSVWQQEAGTLKNRSNIRAQIKSKESQLKKQGDAFLKAQLTWESKITPKFRVKLPGPTQEALLQPNSKRTAAQKKLAADLFKTTATAKKQFPLVAQIAKLRASEPVIATTMVMKERTKDRRVTHIHRRGNFLDHGARVLPRIPSVLPQITRPKPNRLDFAKWLVDGQNPLTARVVMNRFWQRFFGKGIVETENDFGTQGIAPTHPQLLDWLAAEFVELDWSVKAIHRRIVMSATYQQTSRFRRELLQRDPFNHLLARQSRLRLEAEIVRDAALSAAGLLTPHIGGPSVFPPQPKGVFAFTQDPKPWKTEQGSSRYRRGMYTHFWRSSPYPALMVFDFPNSNVTCTRRVRSNTPIQALTLANDVVYVECAQSIAQRVLGGKVSSDMDRIRYAFRLCLARTPSQREVERLVLLLNGQRSVFRNNPKLAKTWTSAFPKRNKDIAEAASWSALCRVLINLDEFITRE